MRKRKSLLSKIGIWSRNIALILFVSSIGIVVIYRFVPIYLTPLMVIRTVEQLTGKNSKLSVKKKWISLDKISPSMVNAVIAAEDNNFMLHHGFDFDAIKKARKKNKRGGRLYGASTISQQTAKNVFLWPGRSWVRKGLEVYFTVLIEFFWSKERIMEVYLNVIETGNGIYGVQRASEIYFGKPASRLTKSQAVLIAVSLPNPRKFNPAYPSAYLYRRQSQILHIMNTMGPVNLKK
jgi:monofunctional biosynthetic peptidoglycan transglycosylase